MRCKDRQEGTAHEIEIDLKYQLNIKGLNAATYWVYNGKKRIGAVERNDRGLVKDFKNGRRKYYTAWWPLNESLQRYNDGNDWFSNRFDAARYLLRKTQ